MECSIGAAATVDLPEIFALLQRAGLPVEDLSAEDAAAFVVARSDDGALLGAVALQVFGVDGLLRSLVIDERMRNCGLGTMLTEAAEARAKGAGVRAVYLLTTTADKFFVARGYDHAMRDSAPASIVMTKEFSDLCPSTAAFMCKHLR